jgi:hypothetical protein
MNIFALKDFGLTTMADVAFAKTIYSTWVLELETAKQILEEIFHARPSDV